MDNKNYWTEFCNTTNQLMTVVRNDFNEEQTSFVGRVLSVEVKQDKDKQILKAKKNAALALVEGSKKNDLSKIIEEILDSIRERDKQLNKEIEQNKTDLGEWYNKAKQHSLKLCEELGKYTNNETGVLNIVAYILEEVISREGLKMIESNTKIEEIIKKKRWLKTCKVGGCILLILIALAVMTGLFVMIGTDDGLWNIKLNNIGKTIAGGFILVLLVGVVFLIIRTNLLINNRNREIRQILLLLDKMKIHKMTKHEIDRELECIQETVDK